MRGRALWIIAVLVFASNVLAAVPTPPLSPIAPLLDDLAANGVTRLTLTAEWLRVRQTLGEISAADREREMRAAVEQLRTSSVSIEALRTRRNQAVDRLLRFARSQLASARWPGDPASYHRRANAQLQAAERGWPALRASGGDVDRFLVPVAEVIGWTQQRADGARVFDGFDQELEAAVRAAFSNSGRGIVEPVAATLPPVTPSIPPQTAAGPSCASLAGHWTAQNYLHVFEPNGTFHVPASVPPLRGTWRVVDASARNFELMFEGRSDRYVVALSPDGHQFIIYATPPVQGGRTGPCMDVPSGAQTAAAPPQPLQPAQVPPTAGVPIAGRPGFGPWQVGMDIFDGGDYRNFPIPTNDPAVCMAECERDPRCRAVTYTMPGTYGAPQASCWLKQATGRFGPHASAISAIKTSAPPAGTAMPSLSGNWLFRGVAGQRATIAQAADGKLQLVTERNVRASGYVESATSIVADFPFARGLRGTLTPDGRRINWANGEFWTREAASPVPPSVITTPSVAPKPVPSTPNLTGPWNGPLGIYDMVQTGNSFTWKAGAEIGQGTISGDNLQVTWTGGGSATGRITERTPQGLPIVIGWSNGVSFRRSGY